MPLSFLTELYEPALGEIEGWKFFKYESLNVQAYMNRKLVDLSIIQQKINFPVNAYKGSATFNPYFDQWITADGSHDVKASWVEKLKDGEIGSSYGVPAGYKIKCTKIKTQIDVHDPAFPDDPTKSILKEVESDGAPLAKVMLRPGFCVFESEKVADLAGSSFGSDCFKVKVKARGIMAKGFNSHNGYGNQQFLLALEMYVSSDDVFSTLREIQKVKYDAAKAIAYRKDFVLI